MVPIINGLPGPRQLIQGVNLGSIACLSATLCETAGAYIDGSGTVVVPVVDGVPGGPVVVPGGSGLALTCPTASTCVAVGTSLVFPYVGVVTTITETGGGEPSNEASLSCTVGTSGSGAPIDICTVSDADGIRTVQVTNTATGQKQAALAFDCASAPTSAEIRVPAGTRYRVNVTDCDSPRNKTTFVIRANGNVNQV